MSSLFCYNQIRMNTKIHPTWYPEASVTCACGNTFTLGSAKPSYEVEVCSACHPFYTGQMKFLDTAGRVDAFRAKQQKVAANIMSKAERRQMKRDQRINEEISLPDTLTEFKKTLKKGKKAKKSSEN